jgi:hypothetical protein
MAYCSRCGVEVEDRATVCPLCEAPIQRIDAPADEPAKYPDAVAPAQGRQTRYLVWMVFTAALGSAALLFLTLDAVLERGVSWSLYPLTGAGVLWLFITLVVLFARRPIFVIAGQAVATAGFLVLIDLFNGELEWFVSLGLPIVGVVTGVVVLVWLVARFSRHAAALTTVAVLFGAGAGSVGIDLLITGRLGQAHLSWSIIVLATVAPITAFLLYFHYRLARRIDLGRVLHT